MQDRAAPKRSGGGSRRAADHFFPRPYRAGFEPRRGRATSLVLQRLKSRFDIGEWNAHARLKSGAT